MMQGKEQEQTVAKQRVSDAYAELKVLPTQLLLNIEKYGADINALERNLQQQIQAADDDMQKKESDLLSTKEQKKNYLVMEKSNQISVKKAVEQQVQELAAHMKAANEKYMECSDLLHHRAARGKRYKDILKIMMRHDALLNEFDELTQVVLKEAKGIVKEAYFAEEGQKADREYNKSHSDLLSDYRNQKEQLSRSHTVKISTLKDSMEKKIEQMEPAKIQEQCEICQADIPNNACYEVAKNMPDTIEIAKGVLDLTKWKGDKKTSYAAEVIAENFAFGRRMLKGRTYIQFPYGQSLADEKFNKIISYDMGSREMALEYLAAIEMRMFQSIPAGKFRATMFDPTDLGKNFSLFSVLGEHDERIIATKIWHETDRMEERLRSLVSQIAHVTQDCLKGSYPNIVAYNKAVGKNAEPLQALFIADFSLASFDAECCKLISQILSSGPVCGVFCFIVGKQEDLELGLGMDTLQKTENIVFEHSHMTLKNSGKRDLDLLPIEMPDAEQRKDILKKLQKGIIENERITIKYNEVSENLLEHKERWFQYSSDKNGISIPVGLEGDNKVVSVRFGGINRTQHHALVSGTIGSGKSTFLHTLILSTILRYSPEDVQLYLLDMKRGVEFKVYAEYELPSFNLISTDTTPETALSVLKQVCESRAKIEATLFKKNNVSQIEEYNELPQVKKISRKILIIDEFHELFTDQESETTKLCLKYLQQLVKMGRAWGIYVVLASQILPQGCSEIYSQMLNRIALQSTAEAAKLILDADNEGVDMLTSVDVGSGIFNDKGGDKDANRIFRIAYFSQEEMQEILQKIKDRQEELGYELMNDDDEIILDVNSLSDDTKHPMTQFVNQGILPTELEYGIPLYFAKAVDVSEKFEMNLHAEAGQNLLITGPEDMRMKGIFGMSAMSILFQAMIANGGTLPEKPLITYFDYTNSRKSYGTYDILRELSACYPEQIRVYGKDTVMYGIEQLEKDLQEETYERHVVMFAGLNRAKKLLSGAHTFEKSPRDRLVQLFQDGPDQGMNFIVWANEPDSFLEYYADALDAFDYRIGYQMSDDAFKKIYMSAVVINTSDDYTAVAYDAEAENIKIRILDMPIREYVDGFIEQVDGCREDSGEFDE